MLKHFRVTQRLGLKLAEFEISIPAVLRRAGLPQDLFDQKRILVSTEELFALWTAIGSVSSDPLIGLRLGIETKTERFHPMGIAALSRENFAAAVEHMARYKKLTAPEEILYKLDKKEFRVGFRWLLSVDSEPQVLTDYCHAWMLTIARHGTGNQRLTPLRVDYIQPRTNRRAIERHFNCEVICGAPRNAMVFRAEDARAPFVTRNSELLDLLAPQFEEQLKQTVQSRGHICRTRTSCRSRSLDRASPVDGCDRRGPSHEFAYSSAPLAGRRLQLSACTR